MARLPKHEKPYFTGQVCNEILCSHRTSHELNEICSCHVIFQSKHDEVDVILKICSAATDIYRLSSSRDENIGTTGSIMETLSKYSRGQNVKIV